jgi:polyisoprenyl-phosphate glycosyltransferase
MAGAYAGWAPQWCSVVVSYGTFGTNHVEPRALAPRASVCHMISVVVPAFNERDAVAATVRELRSVLDGHGGLPTAQIIVVDDGSSDGTGSIAEQHGAIVVRHPHNLGYGRALKSGIQAALHDTIVILDADGTYPVADIPRLVDRYREGFDMVVGARSGSGFRESLSKRALRRVLKLLVEFTAGRSVPDVNSGLRVFSRATILPYFPHLCDTFSFTTSLTLAYMMTGRFVTYAPITYVERVGATKVRLLRDALRTLQYIVQAIAYYNPIKAFLLLIAVTVMITAFAMAFAWPAGAPLVALVAVIGMASSVLLFGMALLADVLRQIMRK